VRVSAKANFVALLSIEGKWEQAKGAVKDKVSELTNDEELEAEGEA